MVLLSKVHKQTLSVFMPTSAPSEKACQFASVTWGIGEWYLSGICLGFPPESRPLSYTGRQAHSTSVKTKVGIFFLPSLSCHPVSTLELRCQFNSIDISFTDHLIQFCLRQKVYTFSSLWGIGIFKNSFQIQIVFNVALCKCDLSQEKGSDCYRLLTLRCWQWLEQSFLLCLSRSVTSKDEPRWLDGLSALSSCRDKYVLYRWVLIWLTDAGWNSLNTSHPLLSYWELQLLVCIVLTLTKTWFKLLSQNVYLYLSHPLSFLELDFRLLPLLMF